MKRIEDISELKSGVGTGKKIGNIYWLAKDMRGFIEDERLFLLPSHRGLGIVLSGAKRKQFCFRIEAENIEAFRCEFEPGATYVSELVFSREHPEKCDAERRVLERLGFRLDSQVMLMGATRETVMSHSMQDCMAGYGIRPACRQDASAIESLLYSGLDPITDDLELGDELVRTIEASELWVTVAPDGSICGCMRLESFGKNAWYHHLVIDKAHRGRKLTKPLFYRLAEKEAEGTMLHNWVKKDNAPSRAMLTSLGCEVEQREMEIWTR